MIATTESDVLVKASCRARLHVCKMNGTLIMIHDITVSRQLDAVAAVYGFRNTSLTNHFLTLAQIYLARWFEGFTT